MGPILSRFGGFIGMTAMKRLRPKEFTKRQPFTPVWPTRSGMPSDPHVGWPSNNLWISCGKLPKLRLISRSKLLKARIFLFHRVSVWWKHISGWFSRLALSGFHPLPFLRQWLRRPGNAAPNDRHMRVRIGPIGSLTAESAGTKASQCCRNQCCTGHVHDRCKRMTPSKNQACCLQLVTISWMPRHLCRRIPTVSKRVGVSASSKRSENDWRREVPT